MIQKEVDFFKPKIISGCSKFCLHIVEGVIPTSFDCLYTFLHDGTNGGVIRQNCRISGLNS